MKRLAAFLVICVLGACTSAPRAPQVAITAPKPVAVAPVELEGGVVTETCEAFSARVKKEIEKAVGSSDPDRQPHTLVGFCSHGWRIDMPSLSGVDARDVPFTIEAQFTVVHTDANGVEAFFNFPPDTLSNYGVREPKTPVVFDFDGDGEPELFVDVREIGDEGHYARMNALVTFTAGRIVRYARAERYDIDTLEDVDFDGRPDIRMFAGYTDGLEACQSGFEYDRPPSRFVAHSLRNGDFTTGDLTARRYAQTWCPAKPAFINDSTDALCARLWSHDARHFAREMRRVSASCVTGWCEREVNGTSQPPLAAEDCGRRQQWFAHEPPFSF